MPGVAWSQPPMPFPMGPCLPAAPHARRKALSGPFSVGLTLRPARLLLLRWDAGGHCHPPSMGPGPEGLSGFAASVGKAVRVVQILSGCLSF